MVSIATESSQKDLLIQLMLVMSRGDCQGRAERERSYSGVKEN